MNSFKIYPDGVDFKSGSYHRSCAANSASQYDLMRRFCPSWVLSLILLTLCVSVRAQDFTYTTNNGTITITRYTGSDSAVTVPSVINGLPVTSIGGDAFNHRAGLAKVTIPNSITNIGTGAFQICQDLTEISIPDSVLSVGDYAFYACQSLTSVSTGKGVTSIGNRAFYECISLTNILIGGSVTSIGLQAFAYCVGLTGLTIPGSVTNLEDGAFLDCSRLTAITVDATNSVYSSVGGVMFNKDQTTLIQYPGSKSGSYTIPNSVTRIGDSAFYHCGGLTRLTIPNSVRNIGGNAFLNCYSLTNVTIPNSVVSIGASAFAGCALTGIFIPFSVTNIGDGAFRGGSLTAISVDSLNPVYSSVSGVLFDKTQTTLIQYPTGKADKDGRSYMIPDDVIQIGHAAFAYSYLATVKIPNSVTKIGDEAFNDCVLLASVTIPDSVVSIGDSAFWYCISLSNVTIGANVGTVGSRAFFFCTSLTSVMIPSGVTSLGDEAFNQCTSLTNVVIGRSVASFGVHSFADCPSLTTITVDPLNPSYSSAEGVLLNKRQTTLIECPEGKLGNYAIPYGVTTIGKQAFAFCTNLTSVTIPNSTTNIEQGAFWVCSSLAAVYFQGDAPQVLWDEVLALAGYGSLNSFDMVPAILYYLPGTAGWDTTLAGQSTALWSLPRPQILNRGSSFGAQTNGFGFIISWATNTSVVVEASTDLAKPVWSPLGTNTLNGGSSYFRDLYWTNYPGRFYRLRSP